MTADERQAEFDQLQWCEVPFGLIHERLEALIGRPVFTHEFGLNWQGLREEARWERAAPSFQEILELIPPEKRVVIVASKGADE